MAQTNFTPISIYYSATATNVPTAGNLVAGELALNTADGKLFYKDSAGVVQTLASKSTGTIGGSTTQVQYNSSGSFAGSANMTFNGTTFTLANDASISGLTVGKGGGSIATNTAIGAGGALGTNVSGTDLTAVGRGALSLNTASYNTALGRSTLENNSTGANNTAAGYQALVNNTTASNNTAIGYQAGYSNTVGIENTFIGKQAGYLTTGTDNTYVGVAAGYAATTGVQNTFIGYAAGTSITTGGKNVILGTYSGNQGGLDIRTASNYIVLSDGDGNPRLIGDNAGNFVFGSGQTGGSTAQLSAGVVSVYMNQSDTRGITIKNANASNTGNYIAFYNSSGTQQGYIGQSSSTVTIYSTVSDYRLKTVIEAVSNAGQRLDALEPIEYDWKEGGRTRGFLAHKFAEVYPNSVSGEKDAVDKEGKPIYQGMQASTPEVMADLIAEIQSLRKRVAQLESK